MNRLKAVLGASLFALSSGLCNAAFAAPEVGWWWNPNESGRGFFVESHDGVTFIGAYLYDDDGHAKWLVSGGPNPDPYNWTGDLYYKTNGQTLFGTYVAPGDAIVVGQLSVHFNDDTHATLTWPGGQIAIERQIFGTGDAPFQPFSGWWWNPDESGSGYSVELQGNNLFIVGFMYEDSGRPVWYYSAGPMSDATTYHGDVLQFANGQTMGGAYRPPAPPTKIATLDMAFTATDEATLTFTEASASPASSGRAKAGGRSSSKSLKPQFPKKGTYQPPAALGGYFSINTITHDAGTPDLIYDAQYTIRLDFDWNRNREHDVQLPDGTIEAGYSMDFFDSATVTHTFNATAVTSAGKCTQTASLTLPLAADLGFESGSLGIDASRKYNLYMVIFVGNHLPVAEHCEFYGGGSYDNVILLPLAGTDFSYEGAVVSGTIAGGGTKTTTDGSAHTTQHYEWSWTGK